MVYGLDAILPVEFLAPTMRVAQEIKWTGHELSSRLEDLEQLDETRLATMVGIYDLKHRQKKFHDSHNLRRGVKLCDLALLYTLNQF